jgi:hypothetical protein
MCLSHTNRAPSRVINVRLCQSMCHYCDGNNQEDGAGAMHLCAECFNFLLK